MNARRGCCAFLQIESGGKCIINALVRKGGLPPFVFPSINPSSFSPLRRTSERAAAKGAKILLLLLPFFVWASSSFLLLLFPLLPLSVINSSTSVSERRRRKKKAGKWRRRRRKRYKGRLSGKKNLAQKTEFLRKPEQPL